MVPLAAATRLALLIPSLVPGACGTVVTAQGSPSPEWNQWGGPGRGFRLSSRDLADAWPDDGPPRLWRRQLAGLAAPDRDADLDAHAGHAGIAIGGETLFTLVRVGDDEVALALDVATGAVRWRRAERAVPAEELDYGAGPFATPLVENGVVYHLGGTGVLRAHRCEDGELLWRRDLERDFPGPRPDRGYAPSPLLVAGSLVLPVGAPGAAVVALDPADGRTRWCRHDFDADYASPIVVRVDDVEQLVCHMEADVIGLDPGNGDLLWSIASHADRTRHVICPVDLGRGGLLASTTRSLQRLDLATPFVSTASRPTVRWTSRRIRTQVGNLLFVPAERLVLGSNSASSGAVVAAVDVDSGELLWRDRGLDTGFLWLVGERVLGLASDGELVLARPDRDGLTVLARHDPFDGEGARVWSAPAMRGTTVFVKDRSRILALDLGKS